MKFKKFIILMMGAFLLIGCGASNSSDDKLKVALLINGDLGDKSFFDSAADGVKKLGEDENIKTHIVETGYDETKWEPALEDLSNGSWDIVVVGTWSMKEILEDVAERNPDQKYVFFDSEVDYENRDLDNVHSILYKQNEGSFLAGALAALVTESEMPYANKESAYIGFVGAQDIPVVNDFLVGYIEGALHVNEDVKIAISYIGDFENTAKGKEMSLAQYNQGVDIGFNVAGQAGLGQIDAAKDANKYSIGVNTDQHDLFKDSDEGKANAVVSSMLKRVDNSIIYAIEGLQKGELKYGETSHLGIQEESVGLARNDYYNEIVPEDIRSKIETIEEEIVSGKIKISSAMGMDKSELDKLRAKVQK